MDPKHYLYQLPSGMKVLLMPRKTHGLVYFSIVMKNGLIDETAHSLGFTHTGEHLLAQYTSKKFPTHHGVRSKLGFFGVENNAFTSTFDTGYWMIGKQSELKLIMDLMSSMYFGYKFTNDWNKQRNIVLEEIKMRGSDTWVPLLEKMNQTIYPNHRLSFSRAEELKCLSTAQESDVVEFTTNRLNPKCTLILIEGDFELKPVWLEIKRMFGAKGKSIYEQHIQRVEAFHGPKLVRCPIPSSKVSKIIYLYQLIGLQQFDYDADATIMMMMRHFCNGYYSKLYQILRERHGLIYGIDSKFELSPTLDIPGSLRLEIKVDPVHVKKVIKIINAEIQKLKTTPVSHREMQRLRNNLHFQKSIQMLNKKPGKYVENMCAAILWNQPTQTFSKYFECLNNVKPSQILRMAARVFNNRHLLIGIGDGEK